MKFCIIIKVSLLLASCFSVGQSQSLEPIGRVNLGFRLVVHYPYAQLEERGLADRFEARGNGLGLSWISGTPLDFVGNNTWELTVRYNQTLLGYQCADCEDNTLLPLSRKFEYRIYSDGGQRDMLGANFVVPLPISRTSTYFEQVPAFHCHPWFFSQFGTVTTMYVTSHNDSFIGTREIAVFLPPSFTENTLKSYPVMIAFDAGRALMNSLADYLAAHMVDMATVQEAIVVGSDDYRLVEGRDPDKFLYASDRSDFLCPVTSIAYGCINGTMSDGCEFCMTNFTDRQDFWRQMQRCGEEIQFGGRGYDYVRYFVTDVLDGLQLAIDNRALTDRSHLLLSGCSFGGLMACHAGWTMPGTFGMVACQSPSLYFPMNEQLEHEFEFLNVTLQTQRENRPPQFFYLDAGALEEEGNVLFAQAAMTAGDSMNQLNTFSYNDNLWVNIYMDQTHGNVQCLNRLWVIQQLMLRSEGGPWDPTVGL